MKKEVEVVQDFRQQAVVAEAEKLQGCSICVVFVSGGILSYILKITAFFSFWFSGIEYALFTVSPIFLALLLALYSVLFEKRLLFSISEKKIERRTRRLISDRKVSIEKTLKSVKELEEELRVLENL